MARKRISRSTQEQVDAAPPPPPTETVAEATQTPDAEVVKPASKKQAAKERGQRLAQLLAEKRANGELKKSSTKPKSKSSKAGIFFPVHKILTNFKKANPNRRVFEASGVLLAGVLEYLTAEILELAGNVSHEFKRNRITPRHIYLAVENDQELEKLLENTIMMQAGTVPHIHPALLKKPKVSTIPRRVKHNEHSSEHSSGEEAQAPERESVKRKSQSEDREDEHEEHENGEDESIQSNQAEQQQQQPHTGKKVKRN